MNPVVYHLVGGPGFLAGAVLVPLGLLGAAWGGAGRRRMLGRLAIVVGTILVVVSATPLPVAVLVLLGVTNLVAIGGLIVSRRVSQRVQRGVFVVAVLSWGVAIGCELSWMVSPRLTSDDQPRLFVIGDSVSAGTGKTPWPERLAAEHGIEVENLAVVGATVGSAIEQARRIDGAGVVVVEIGGNDVLGPTTPEEFERRLDALLAELESPQHTVVMFELPVPPTYERFGRIQRRLARRHGVRLVPRRALLGLFTTEGATLDSIHLSEPGHDRMATIVWGIVAPALGGV